MKKFLLPVCCLTMIMGRAPLMRASVAAPAKIAKKAAPVLLVQGKIKAIARAPRPRSVPYKDSIIAIQLSGVKALKGHVASKSVLVFVWGMRNNKLMPAASFKANRTIKVSLVPWEKVEGKLGGYNRRELDSDEAMSLDTYWGEIK